jgi:hypothetical protein
LRNQWIHSIAKVQNLNPISSCNRNDPWQN